MCSHHWAHELADPSYSDIAIPSAAHVVPRNRNLTMRYPARQGLIGVANNYAHSWRFFTCKLWQHSCIIIVDSASATMVSTNWLTCGSSVIPLRITWLTNMFTYFASRYFAYEHHQWYVTCTCFVQTCIFTAAKGESLTPHSPSTSVLPLPTLHSTSGTPPDLVAHLFFLRIHHFAF